MAGLLAQAYSDGAAAQDEMEFDLVDALAIESDPRVERMLDLMRGRGWASWTRSRQKRLADPPAEPPGVVS